jgi:GST-like protein
MIELFYWPTPNGKKITILLEELGLPYEIKPINIGRGDQFDPDFLRLSPNNRMPALIDTAPKSGKGPVRIFESAAMMQYLAEREGKFLPSDPQGKYDVLQWLAWQTGNQGPKFGEYGHFKRAAQSPANGDQAYALKRFGDEGHHLYGVMELGLYKKEWLAAGEYTIADMICYPWAITHKMRDINIDEFPNVKRWLAAMADRPGVKKGMSVGLDLVEDPAKISDEEKARRAKITTGQRATPIPKAWG